jgi:hypothetical protein
MIIYIIPNQTTLITAYRSLTSIRRLDRIRQYVKQAKAHQNKTPGSGNEYFLQIHLSSYQNLQKPQKNIKFTEIIVALNFTFTFNITLEKSL